MALNTPNLNVYQIHLVGNVLCVEMRSVWSRGTVNKVLAETQELVAEIKNQPWAALVNIRDWIMPTLEALEGFQNIYDWCAANNQTHEVTLCRFDTQKNIIGDVSKYDAEHQLYTQSPEDAAKWLTDKGFTFSLKEWQQLTR
ncbi:hypothetical protein [Paraglaciecola sp. 2405UD69-4]|uniref:hypothetical protein n=1 Tax=Paraglaciecola sp. 2405UD69-4 TaxID=3391836 RepID=UPI0039C8FE48